MAAGAVFKKSFGNRFCFELTWGMSGLAEECVPNQGDAEW